MKTVIVGDTHGRTLWKQITGQLFDKFVFIGDYLDTHEKITGEQQLSNLLDIIQFKKDYPDKVILLIGNHDYHYMSFLNVNEQYSGFQSGMQYIFNDTLKENIELFQMAYQVDDFICSHAGISQTFLENNGYKQSEVNEPEFKIVDFINDLWKYKPLKFKFTGYDPYGDNITQTPIWIRPQSLYSDRIQGFNQVMGHTTVKKITVPTYNNGLWFIDTLGTSGEYLVIENGKPSVQTAVTTDTKANA